MLRPRVSVSVFVVATVLLASIAPLTLGTNGDYDLDIAGSVDTVDRTVSTSYGTVTITEVGRADAGESVTVSVAAATDDGYTITVLDGEQRIRRSRSGSGDVTTTFDTDGLEAGTYAVAVGNQSTDEVYEVEPLVIRAYEVVVESNTTVEEGDTLDVTVDLKQVQSGEQVRNVQIAVTNGSESVSVDATPSGDLTYTADVPVDDFAPGDYSLYAVVRSDDTTLGENELVGVSDERTIEVVEQSTTTESDGTDSSTGSSSTGGDDSSDATTTETETPSDTTTATTTTPDTRTETTTEATTTEATTTVTETTTTTTAPTTTDDGVITPNEQTTTQAQTTSSELPNPAVRALFGLLVVFGVGQRIVRN